MRVILHSDLNNFFASVELKKFPGLREKPVAVGGSEEMRHGIVLAKNEAAKAFGIKTGETLWQARLKCPGLTVLPPHYDEYAYYSRAAREIYYRYTDMIEPFGMDEAWLDVTHSLKLWKDGLTIADELRRCCREELGLTVSVGVSFNKFFAKLGSDMKKPDAVTVIDEENFKYKVWPLPVGDLLYVGRATEEALRRRGIRTIGELAACDPHYLAGFLGKQGYVLHNAANGNDMSPVEKAEPVGANKTIGNGITMPHDMHNMEEAKPLLCLLADTVSARCRKAGVKAAEINLHIKDDNFETRSMHIPLPQPSALSDDLYHAAVELLQKNYRWQRPLRAITLTAVLPREQSPFIQTALFDTSNDSRKIAAEQAVDEIRARFGKASIGKAILLADTEHGFEVSDHSSLKPE